MLCDVVCLVCGGVLLCVPLRFVCCCVLVYGGELCRVCCVLLRCVIHYVAVCCRVLMYFDVCCYVHGRVAYCRCLLGGMTC